MGESASLNKYGRVELDYMANLVSMTEDELTKSLEGKIYYNPLTWHYEVKDRFVSGKVIQNAEDVE